MTWFKVNILEKKETVPKLGCINKNEKVRAY
jgi:hypothetical protein